jgi:vitamin B12 transporter
MTQRKYIIGALGVLALAPMLVQPRDVFADSSSDTTADETTVVVTATRTPVPLDKVASSTTVITAKELAASHSILLVDALRQVPGISVNQSGGIGAIATVSIRGADAGSTLVMIDGVPVNNPSSTNRSYDFSNLTVDNIDRIEILRGAQSTLYGSDAMAGVINIITKKGKGAPQTTISAEGGSMKTGSGSIASSGETGSWNYSASASKYVTSGYPLADFQANDTHDDGYRNNTLSASADRKISNGISLGFSTRYTNAVVGLTDPDASLATDDGTHTQETEQLMLGVHAKWIPAGGKWDNSLNLSFAKTNQDYADQAPASSPALSNYLGKSYRAAWQTNYTASKSNLMTFGAERSEEAAQYSSAWDTLGDKNAATTGYYAQDQITITSKWNAVVGGRVDDHENFGQKTTYRIASSYDIVPNETKFKTSLATGFKAPTLFQLFDPSYGNPNLKPESDTSFDLGIEQSLAHGRGAASVTYFHNNYTDMISADPITYVDYNIAKATTYGFEGAISYKLTSKLKTGLGYTYTHTAGASGDPLLRRPGNIFTANAQYQASRKLDLDCDMRLVGEQYDTNYATYDQVTLPSYFIANIAGSYKISTEWKAFARVDNLFNKHYEEVYSYRSPERAIYGGASFSF